ncbi:MAG: septal ring lytic transglycosylase RlpA family protein [Thermodesulfobacteriota bacterium]
MNGRKAASLWILKPLAAPLLVTMVCLMAGCSVQKVTPLPSKIVMQTPEPEKTTPSPKLEPPAYSSQSYLVGGKRYYILATARGYVQEGLAMYYGRELHGRRTASGERFNMNALTAAHRTLPLQTTVKVTNLSNSKSVTVRVNDRGPFNDDYLIDLSFAAARALDMVRTGSVRVRVEALDTLAGASVSPVEDQRAGVTGPKALRLDAAGVVLNLNPN